ncbi:hypothetical protein CA267_007310 [Alteromonas pelagimontana]|uniref:Uncharacterized protein n=1 Tax=Alteromonas pelagimontana TaxID=1858656 RepID=A0A6M4MC50_9ALTE|nr:hypothetical protein [Alteromonas pelagimontana]QJR80597.1 hypothetical protein CA267_007310 [Alteromonas pelagimontana]
MFTFRRVLTAFTLTGIMTANAVAAENSTQAPLQRAIDAFVTHAGQLTKQELSTQVTYEVLTASHQFEPDIQPKEMVAKITVRNVKKENVTVRTENDDV